MPDTRIAVPSITTNGTVAPFDPIDYMIRDLEYGLKFSIEQQGRNPADDTAIYCAPHYWTHGKIRAWIKALKDARST